MCSLEFPDLEREIHLPYVDDGVLVFGIHDGESQDDLSVFIETTDVTFPLVADRGTLLRLAFPEGIIAPYPRDVIVDKDLTIRMIRSSFDADEMVTLIDELLEE